MSDRRSFGSVALYGADIGQRWMQRQERRTLESFERLDARQLLFVIQTDAHPLLPDAAGEALM